MIFNIVVDAVICEVLKEVSSPQETKHGIGKEAGARNLVFVKMREGNRGGSPSGCRTP